MRPPDFHIGSRGPDLGLHVCEASALLTELSSHPNQSTIKLSMQKSIWLQVIRRGLCGAFNTYSSSRLRGAAGDVISCSNPFCPILLTVLADCLMVAKQLLWLLVFPEQGAYCHRHSSLHQGGKGSTGRSPAEKMLSALPMLREVTWLHQF